jgi:hypothetical protein
MAEDLDLRADLGAQLDAATEGTDVQPEVTSLDSAPADAAAQTVPDDQTDHTRDPATGRFVPRTADAAPREPEGTTPQAQQTVETAVDLPPHTWTAGAKAAYVKASAGQPLTPDEAKTLVAEQRKREADFTNGIRKFSEAAGQWQRIEQIAQPYEAMIKAAGGHERVVSDLLNTNWRLVTATPQEKTQLLLEVAKRFGADMTGFGAPQSQTQGIDPQAIQRMVQEQLNPHMQRFDQFQNQYLTAQQRSEQQQQQETQGQIEAFRNATDPKTGQPQHVYFENVRGTMAALLESGTAKTLEDAYEAACLANPEVRRFVLAEQRKAEDAARLAETQRAANDAKRALGVNVSGQGGAGMADASKRSLRDDLAAAWDGGGRV